MIIKPTKKELDRGCVNNGRKYTIVTRRQHNKKYLIAAVYEDGKVLEDSKIVISEKKKYNRDAVREVLRWIDKLGGDSPMASKSRFREVKKQLKRGENNG